LPLVRPDHREDEQRELKVLGLPVLQHFDTEPGGGDGIPERGRNGVVGGLLLVVRAVPGDRLPGERGEEQDAEDDRERVVPGRSARSSVAEPGKRHVDGDADDDQKEAEHHGHRG
jgi:hypothetical protein